MKNIGMMVAAAVCFLAGCAGQTVRAGAGLPVRLTVREVAGVDRASDPVTTGVPFARGALARGATLRLADASGRRVPLQTRVLAQWPDGSIRWLLLDFQASVPAGRAATFRLEPAGRDEPRQKPMPLRRTPATLEIDTGPMQVTLNRRRFDLFQSVKIDGREVLRPNGGLFITDVTGKTRTSTANLAAGYDLKVVEHGPLRTVLCATGEVQATARHRLGFTCWYFFYTGKKFVRVFFTVRNLAGRAFTQTDQHRVQDLAYEKMVLRRHPGNLAVEAIDLVLPIAPRSRTYTLGGEKPVSGTLTEGTVKLYQDSSASWPWQVGTKKITDPRLVENQKFMASQGKPNLPYYEWVPSHYRALLDKKHYVGCTFRGYRTYTDGKQTGGGDRAPGWARLGDTVVGVRYFWQMYPKSIALGSDGSIRIGLWPKEWSNPHVFEGHIHKTHELLFAFGVPGGAAEAEAVFRRFDRRLLALAPREHYCESGAFAGFLMPENRKEYPKFEDWALTAVRCGVNPNINPSWDSSLEIEREKYDQYGVWHFGDTSKRGWRGFGQYLELDIPYCLAAHFARTRNRAFFDELEIHERQRQDIPAHGGGYGHQKGESSHYYTTGALFYYYLTGLEHIKQSIKVSHDAFARVGPWHARSFAVTMWSNLDMYRAFDDADPACGQPWHFPHPPLKKADYLRNIRKDLRWFLGNPRRPAQDPATGFRPYGRFNFQEFMLGMMMDALGRYCVEFPEDREWRDRLVALANAVMKPLPDFRYKPTWLTVANTNGLTYAYLFTGRDKYLDFAAKIMDKQIFNKDKTWPRFRTGTGSGKHWSEFGHRLTQTHMWARRYRSRHGTPPPPPAVTDLAATVKNGRVTLTWTAPVDGAECDYVVKVAPKPFKDDLASRAEGRTAANWWTTPPAKVTLPGRIPKGAKVSAVLSAPPGSCVAVRVVRRVGPISTVSDLSNVVRVGAK